MKVLAILPDLHGDNPGGVQVSGELAWDALQRETDARAVFVTSRPSAAWEALRNRFQPDIVLFWHLDLLRLAPLLHTRAPRVLFLHGIEAWRRPGLLTRRLLRNTTLLANSQYTWQRTRASNPEVRAARIVHLGLGAAVAASAAPAGTPAAIMIGRLDSRERYKGHHEIIRCWHAVMQRVPAAQLWIVGDGDLRSELEALAGEQAGGGAIRFFGRVTESEKQALLQAARCLALPSRAEGFGLVYLEAMRTGRPCLVGVDAGVEVINPPQGGLSVDPADTPALVHALAELLQRSEAWQDGARARYAENFTAAHFQTRLLSALRQVS